MAQKLALVIGNSDYQDPALARLKAPDADVRALTELLRHPDIGQFNDVVPLVNASEAATRRAIASFFARANPDDLLLLYFSGHGVLDDKGRLYLAVNDSQRDLLQATAISTVFVTDAMDSSRSRRQVLILDCCHSGAFGRGARAATEAKAVTQTTFEGVGYGRAVLTATDATQYAWEGEAVIGAAENSVFTHFMIEGLRTGAADTDNDGDITLEELYNYIYGEVVKQTPKQTPRKWSYNQQGEFLIARNTHPRRAQPLPLPPDLQQSVEDLRPWVREGSVRELERLLFGAVPGLALAAHGALSKLKDDDSRRVALAAIGILEKYEAERAPSPPAHGSSQTEPPPASAGPPPLPAEQPAAAEPGLASEAEALPSAPMPEPLEPRLMSAEPAEPDSLTVDASPTPAQALAESPPTGAEPAGLSAGKPAASQPLVASQAETFPAPLAPTSVEHWPLPAEAAEPGAPIIEVKATEAQALAAPPAARAVVSRPAARVAPEVAALFRALWLPVLIVATGWALSRAIVQAFLPPDIGPTQLVWFLNWVLGGAAGGVIMGLALHQFDRSFGKREIGWLVGDWAVAWAIIWMLIPAFSTFRDSFGITLDDELLFYASLAIGGGLGGYGLAVIVRRVVPGLNSRHIWIIATGWALGWTLAEAFVVWIHRGSDWVPGWGMGGLVAGLIGGATTLWQMSTARREPVVSAPPQTAAPLPTSTSAMRWASIALTCLAWGLGLAIGAALSHELGIIAGPVLARGVNVYLLEPVATWVLGAAIGGALTGLVLRPSLPALANRQVMLLAAASAAAAALGWMTAASLRTFGYELSLSVPVTMGTSLGLALGGAVAGYAFAAACGLSFASGRWKPALLVTGGWALGLGLANYLGGFFSVGADMGVMRVAVTLAGLVGLIAGLIGGAATFWQLAQGQ